MLLIDTDPGLDDVHALAMATTRLEAADLLVTTVAGNVDLATVTANAQWFLGTVAPDVRLHAGASGPLSGSPVHAAHIHGADGLGGAERPSAQPVQLGTEHAVDTIVAAVREHGPDLTIAAIGPLTNLAAALHRAPDIAESLGRLVVMGGSPACRGNASVTAEFNVFADPVAAETVFSRFPRTTLVTWDLSLTHRFSAGQVQDFFAGSSSAARTLRGLHEHRLAADAGYAASTDFGRADPLALAVALDPTVVTDSVRHPVLVDTSGGLAHGATFVDWRDAHPDRPAIEVVTALDADRTLELLTV